MIIRRRGQFLLTGLTVAVLAGCSGSSSDGGSPQSPAPNSLNTAHAAKTESFHGVSAKANHIIGGPLPLMRGVASEFYSGHTLTVTYRSTADKTDQQNVENIVRQAKQQALAKPTKTPKAK
jgi:hypothetical protein